MIIKGSVENIVFRNEENGYTVINIFAEDRLLTAFGIFPVIQEGETLSLVGEFKTNPKYGEQFEVTEVTFEAPTDKAGIINYLASGLFRGVGEITADAIVGHFGLKTLEILEKTPERLREVRGIGAAKAREIAESFRNHSEMQNTLLFLQKHGISMGQSLKIYRCYGDDARELITENPYRLVEDIEGIGFLTADKIAEKLGVEQDSDFRIMAAVTHTLLEAAGRQGHTCLPEEKLLSQTAKLIHAESSDRIKSCLPFMQINDKIKFYRYKEEDRQASKGAWALSINYNLENSIAAKLLKLNNEAQELDINIDGELDRFESENSIALHTKQREAVALAINRGTVVITGGPGTGKTTIIKCILSLMSARGHKVLLAAPTGRAGKRLAEATDCEAKTIHRMLGMDFSSGKPVFKFNELNNLETDVVIIDEISMADIYIFNALLKAMPQGARLILVGDKDQLPSVSAGNILADIIDSDMLPVISLTEIYRQDANSLIVLNAHRINRGEMPVIDNASRDFFVSNVEEGERQVEAVVSLLTERLPKYLDCSIRNIQVLSPMKKGIAGVNNLNVRIQEAVNPYGKEITINGTVFREGDKVMQTVNNYDLQWEKGVEQGEGVFNGDVGYLTEIGKETLTVDFEDGKCAVYGVESREELIPAYAVSVHKSQGSEFRAVILVLSNAGYMLLNRNLLYTAITRAREAVVIVGPVGIIKRMVSNNYVAERYSLLKEFIWENQRKARLLKGE
ncbi:MAG: ATP-dependent RecD-like DNA helicase [Clostridia bacterium]|nr:ATP-dependent RecD-like DNA helicase [Clostridia bacterium]